MKQEDILALAKAGFTRDQIVALAGIQPAPVPQLAPVQQTQPVQQIAPVQQTVPVQQNAPVPQTAPVQQIATSGDPVLDALMGIREDMKKQALLFSSQPSVQTETSEDILASIINPKGEK